MMSTYKICCYICIVNVFICVYVDGAIFRSAFNSPCTTFNNTQGVCVNLAACNNLLNGEEHKYCAFVNGEPIVCCPRPRETLKDKCERYSAITKNPVPRVYPVIYNGEIVTSVLEFPHQVNLGYLNRKNPTFSCGGSLISESWILTAAHCIGSRTYKDPKVADMGLIDQKNRNQFGTHQRINIVEIRKHPLYNSSSRYNDIALLKLERPAKLSVAVVPACLYDNAKINEKYAIATGWGRTETSDRSDNLRKVRLNIENDANCALAYRSAVPQKKLPDGIRSESQFCAGEVNKNTCVGDSGGPLQVSRKHFYIIVGVTSFGRINGCAKGNKIGVYTRVSHYLDWIENVIS